MRTRMYATAAAEAAAFTSLPFVALTVNLPRILPGASRVARAAEALGGLLSLPVVAILGRERDLGAAERGVGLPRA